MAWFDTWLVLNALCRMSGVNNAGLPGQLFFFQPLDGIKNLFDLPDHYRLIAQMPFGKPLSAPGEKDFKPIKERVKVFK